MDTVRNAGFGFLLELEDCYVPRPFAQWIADNISIQDEAIVLQGKNIPLNSEAVSMVLGIPYGNVPINTLEEETGKLEFLALFGRTEIPSISFFGNKLLTEELTDDEFLRCFLTVALATFLCPTSNTKPSTKYMGALVDMSKLKEMDWCTLVHKWNMCYVKKYQTEKRKEKRVTTTLGGCIYQLAVCCLDFNNFGLISISAALPRICFWKGQTIKHFSDMLIAEDGKYRALQIKDEAETCYAEKNCGWASTAKNSNIRKAIDRAAGSCLSDKVKEEIFNLFQRHMKDENLNTCSKSKQVLLDTLVVISASLNCSDSTVKLQGDDECEPTIKESTSERTVRVDSEGNEVSNDERHVNKRRKTTSQQSTSSKARTSAPPFDMKDDVMQNQAAHLVTKITEINPAEQIEVKQPSPKVETLNSKDDSTRNLPSKMQDEDKICKQPEKGKYNTENLGTEKSSSLSYLLLASNLAKVLDGKEQDVISKEEHKHQSPSEFAGFEGISSSKAQSNKAIVVYQRKDKDGQTSKSRGNNKRKDLDLDMNIPAANSISESIQHPTTEGLHPLDIARKKYFFHNDCTPTCRLFEDIDDCGNQITEPELIRPIGMSTAAYDAKIEDAKKSMSTNLIKQVSAGDNNQNNETTQGEFSIHCAQRDPISRKSCKYTDFFKAAEQGDGTINLASPIPAMETTWDKRKTCYSPRTTFNCNLTGSSSQQHSKVYSTNIITGRRLFQDDTIEQPEQDGSKHHPITIQDEQELSPEVKILGERVFIDLTKDIDSLYNTNLTLGSASSSWSKENIPPKRIVYPSKFQCSPYANYDRGPLMLHERKAYANIILLSKQEPHKSTWAVLIDNTKVSLGQLGDSFSENGWVDAYVINVYCRILFRDNHLRQSKKHYFFTTVSDYFLEKWRNEGAQKSMRSRALASFDGAGKALPLHECDRLLFPSVYQSHWFLFVVDFVTRKFIFLDSLYGASSEFHTEIKDKMIQNFINTWEQSRLRRMGFKNFGIAYPNLPMQVGSNACGIFVLKRMQTWDSRNPSHSDFKMKDVKDARVRFAVDILFSLYNTIQEVKKLIKDY